jgi:hypothetical protein
VAYDDSLAAILRADLSGKGGLTERKMFGGLCLMLDGHMVCGLHGAGGMYRVGKEGAAAALALPHVRPMTMGGRPMAGVVEADREAVADPALRSRLLGLALAFVRTLPPKRGGVISRVK